MDFLPHVGRLDDRVVFSMGYNGTGVGPASLLGSYAARIAMGEAVDTALLAADRFRRIPVPALRRPAVRGVAAWYQFLDRYGL